MSDNDQDQVYYLTPHFKLDEFTCTDHVEFQVLNRQIDANQVNKLTQVAMLEEKVRAVLGCGLENHSGYRCPQLNTAVGSSARSQHLLCEAVDFQRWGQGQTYDEETLDQDFKLIIAAAKAGKLKFGQLIKESAKRYTDKNGVHISMWLHISLGAPWRAAERCGQCLSMLNGIFTLVATI
jgi:hypothetical protein